MGLYIEKGKVKYHGLIENATKLYENQKNYQNSKYIFRNEFVKIKSICLMSSNKKIKSATSQKDLKLRLLIKSIKQIRFQEIAIALYDKNGAMLINLTTLRKAKTIQCKANTNINIDFNVKQLPLLNGTYEIGLYIKDNSGKNEINIRNAQYLDVIEEVQSKHEIKPNNDGCVSCFYTITEN